MGKAFYLTYSTGFLLWICAASSVVFAKDKKTAKYLDFKKVSYSQITPIRDVGVAFRDGGKVFLLPSRERQLFQTQYLPDDAKFMAGATLDTVESQRFELDKSIPTPAWSGFFPIQNGMTMLLDGSNLAVASFEPSRSWAMVSHRNIVMDLFRPAPDARGEPTHVETSAARKKMATEIRPLRGSKNIISGAAELPSAWTEKKERSFLLLTRMPSFPLVTMRCEVADSTQCQLERSCFVQGLNGKESGVRQGLAISDQRKMLIIGNREKQSLQVYKYQDCFHVAYVRDIELPEELRGLRSIYVDDEDNLWLSTEGPDDYRNASVYMWAAKDW